MVLVTDGGDDRSKVSKSQLMRTLADHNVRAFAVIFSEAFVTVEETEGPLMLQDVVGTSGGISFVLNPRIFPVLGEPKHLEKRAGRTLMVFLHTIASAVDRPTLIHISWPANSPPKRKQPFKIELRDDRGRKLPDSRLAYPRRPPICPVQQSASQ